MSITTPIVSNITKGITSGIVAFSGAYSPLDYGFNGLWDGNEGVTEGDSNRVASWDNLGTTGGTLSQGTVSQRPRTNIASINGNNAVSSDGIANCWLSLDGSTKAAATETTALYSGIDFANCYFGMGFNQTDGVQTEAHVGNKTTSGGDIICASWRNTENAYLPDDGANYNVITGAYPRGSDYLMEIVSTGGEILTYRNGTLIDTQSVTMSSWDAFIVFARAVNTRVHYGAISDLFIGSYNAALFEQNQSYYLNKLGL